MRTAIHLPTLDTALTGAGLPGAVVLESVDSTNSEVRRRAVPYQLVITEHQVAGRGRLGRVWEDVPRAGLAMSVLVPTPAHPGWLPLLAGLALHRTLTELSDLTTALKWPNDVLAAADVDETGAERKLAGILCELVDEGVIVGIGVNVDHTRDELPVPTATSLRVVTEIEGGAVPGREVIAATWLRHLVDLVEQSGSGHLADVRHAYTRACATLGRRVRVHRPDGSIDEVTATGIDPDGRLVLDGPTGSATVSAGDVIHIRPAP